MININAKKGHVLHKKIVIRPPAKPGPAFYKYSCYLFINKVSITFRLKILWCCLGQAFTNYAILDTARY